MARAKLSATCAAVLLSITFVSAQTTPGAAPDRPLPNNNSAAKSQQTTTISGCVVRDAANEGQATITINGTSYALVGKTATEFDRYLGKRVEVTGTRDSGSTGARATSESTTPNDKAAAKDRTATALKTNKGTTDDLTSRLQVKTIRIVSPSCL